MLHTLYRDPFAIGHPQINMIGEGLTVAEIVKRTPNLPRDFSWSGEVTVNGELVYREYWDRIRPKDGMVVAMHAHIGGGGGGGGKQVFGLLAAIALSVITGGIAAGALAPFLGTSFAAGTIGASVLAGAVGVAGALAISALSAPPTVKPGGEQAESGLRLEAASVDGNLLEANTPVPRVIGTRKVFPPFLSEPIIELIGQDEYVEAVYGLAGPHDLSDIRLGDASIDLDADEQKDIEIEVRNGLPGESPVTLTPRQGRTTEPQIQMSVHTVDPENQANIDGSGPESLPVFHAITTRIAPNENWIHFSLAGLAHQDTNDLIRVPFRMRMRRRGDTAWRNLPEFHYQNDTQTQVRLQVRIFWGDAWTDVLPTPPASDTGSGFVEARKSVPAQDVQPLGTVYNADSYFSAGAGNDSYRATTEVTTNVRNILLYADHVDIYLDTDSWSPGIWDIEVKRGAAFVENNYNPTNYEYSADVLDFFGRRDSGVLPLTRENLLDQFTLVRMVNVWNEHPIQQANMTLVALKARNRSVSKLSALASGYVRDLAHGRGPEIRVTSASMLSYDVPTAADVEVLALIRPLEINDSLNPEAVRVFLRGSVVSGNRTLYQFGFRNLTAGDGGFNAVAIDRFVGGSGTNILNAEFHWELNKNFFLRFRAEGTSLKGKAWPATIAEPDEWTIELTDTNVSGDGFVGLHTSSVGPKAGLVNWFSVGLNGDSAPMPPLLRTPDTSMMLLLHFDGTDGSNTFVDSSLQRRTLTANGNVQIDTAQSKFGGASALFDGTGDFITFPDFPGIHFGSGDFTIHFWFNCTRAGGVDADIMSQSIASGQPNTSFIIDRNSSNQVRLIVSDGVAFTSVTGTQQFTNLLNTGWHHYAAVRSGNTLMLFVDGVLNATATFTGSINNMGNNISIGSRDGAGASPWQGWLEEIVVLKDVALWTANFDVPTSATSIASVPSSTDFSEHPVGSSIIDPTRLLLHFDGADASTTFSDNSPFPKTMTPAGNAQIDTAQSKFGGASGLFDGTGDWVTTPDADAFVFDRHDWTIDFWFRLNGGNGTLVGFFGQGTTFAASDCSINIMRNAANQLEVSISDGTNRHLIVSATLFSTTVNTGWNHYAVVRRDANIMLFANGVLESTLNFGESTTIVNLTSAWIVGASLSAGQNPLTGWIDELNVSIGEAKWVDDFTLPTVAHTTAYRGWTLRVGTAVATVEESPNLPYNGGADDWTEFRTTSNPAPHFRDILTGSMNFDPLPGDLLDDVSLVSWRQRCAAADFTCNMVVEGLDVPDLLRVVSSCGYGRLYRSELFGVIQDYDRTLDTPVQIFSPRNSSGLSWRKAFARLPAGFRVNFREEDLDYGSDQVIVLRGNVEGTSSRLEQVTYDGLVLRDDVIRRANFDLLQAERRAAFYTFNAPAESIVCRRGDLVGVNSDILQEQYGYARVEEVIYDEDEITGIILDADVEIFNEADFLDTYDVLAVEDVLLIGVISGIAIRHTDGVVTVHRLDDNTDTGDTDELLFATPTPIRFGQSSPFDRAPIHSISPGCLVVIGPVGEEYRRLIISEITPQMNLESQLVCVDEASDMFPAVFLGDES